jgi:hypothetical protein
MPQTKPLVIILSKNISMIVIFPPNPSEAHILQKSVYFYEKQVINLSTLMLHLVVAAEV